MIRLHSKSPIMKAITKYPKLYVHVANKVYLYLSIPLPSDNIRVQLQFIITNVIFTLGHRRLS